LGAIGLGLAGGAIFGRDAVSYVCSSAKQVRGVVKDSVPMEFELARAKDLVDDIIPEMQANIRAIAQQEVEIAALKSDITQSQKVLGDEQMRVQKLRDCLLTSQVSFTFGGMNYNRDELKDDLARKFDHYKEAEVILAGKQRLVENREKSLRAGMQAIEKMKNQKVLLENQIAALEGQFRLVQAAQTGSKFAIDNSKLAQTERVISQIKKQLDVAERVLAHEATFVPAVEVDVVNEKDLVAQVREHVGSPAGAPEKSGSSATGEKGLASAEATKTLP
jgi:cytochrome c1